MEEFDILPSSNGSGKTSLRNHRSLIDLQNILEVAVVRLIGVLVIAVVFFGIGCGKESEQRVG